MQNVRLTERPYKYLVHQQGQFWDLKNEPQKWYRAYHTELQKTVDQIRTWCPHYPRTILDIGCGLGVVDMVMMKDVGSYCVLVDGEDGDGVARKYDQPFGSREVVSEFMDDNQVPTSLWEYRNPEQLEDRGLPIFELVVSLRSWCFHYPPEVYLWFVQKHVAPGTKIILDVRRSRNWRDRLNAIWRDNYILEQHEKMDRICYVVNGRAQ